MGGEAIRGLLLCGPPGTGKSYLAQVIANEAQVPLFWQHLWTVFYEKYRIREEIHHH